MIQKLKFFLSDTLNNLWQHRMRNLFSITIICLSFLTIGIFLSISNNLRHMALQMSRNMAVVLFLEPEISDTAVEALEQDLTRSPLVSEVRFNSARQAYEDFQEKFPDLREIVENLGDNPFPPSLQVSLHQKAQTAEATLNFIRSFSERSGVDDIQYNRERVERMQSFSRLAQAVGFFLGGILILASFFIISNIVKLNVFARKDEIEILRLTGATNTFIRTPFLMEGVILGILGGLLSLILLFLLIRIFPLYLGASMGVFRDFIRFRSLSLSQCLSLILAGGFIGFLGSLSSLARFLKT